MKPFKSILIIAILALTISAQAQTAEEIVDNYFETIGGEENWEAVKAVKYSGEVQVQGMQLPMTMMQTADGKMMTKAEFQGITFYQGVYDGETLWSTNQMTMKAEKSTAEDTKNFALNMNDFPDPLLNYKEKGYTIELIGKETMEGTDAFKLKLVTEPVTVDGEKQEDVSYYYFDTENFVPIAVEKEVRQGPAKGMTSITKFSDYQEVEGLYFAFSIEEGVKGQPQGTQINIKEIELNPVVEDSMFAFPEQN